MASRLLSEDSDVYAGAIDLLSLLGIALPDNAPGRLYAIWGALTDKWEPHPEWRQNAEQLMREAARDFLAVRDEPELDAYLSRWSSTAGAPQWQERA